MPILRTVKTYRCRSGKRFVRLYRSWLNMRNRVAGVIYSGNGEPIWQGLSIEWQTFEEFRAWALANGYSKARCSLDRKEATCGYLATNCRWLTVRENSLRALHGDDPFAMGGKLVTTGDSACPF